MTRVTKHLGMLVGCIGLMTAACAGDIVGGGGGGGGGDDDPVIGTTAGGETNVISEGWEESPIRFGNNVKMLNFRQIKAEVARATGVTYDWGDKATILGAADYQTSFRDDRTPSATKIITLRKVAFDVCGQMMKAEALTPNVFSAMSPKDPLNAQDPKVAEQVKLIFTHFFLEDPTQAEVDLSTQALAGQVAAGAAPSAAWAGLCTGYLSSMRFLSY